MQVEAIPMLINSDFLNAPLDVKLHLADYKMHGKKSYVFQIKDLLHGIYKCTYISMNDQDINGEALDYLLKNNSHAGEMLMQIADLEQKDLFKTLRAMTAVVNSTTAMTAVLNNTTAMTAVFNSATAMAAVVNSTTAMTAVLNNTTAMTTVLKSANAMEAVVNSTTAMTAVFNSATAMTAVVNSTTAMTTVLDSETAIVSIVAAQYANIKPFILKINGNKEYIKKLFILVQNSSRFKLLYNGDVGSIVNAYENKQGIITFSCLGFSGSSGDNSGVSSRVYNNGELIKDATDAGYNTKSTPDKANAVTIGKTKWGYNSGRYNYSNIACAVYEMIA
nr:MAG TPA: Tail fiber protein [Caudoviricetes sp.]